MTKIKKIIIALLIVFIIAASILITILLSNLNNKGEKYMPISEDEGLD